MKAQSTILAAIAALFLPLVASAQDAGKLVEVVATGHGSTVSEATAAALRSAVEQVVGTMIDAPTLVENDELIEGKILRYAPGMVASSQTIGVPKKSDDGIYSVKVKAAVKKGELHEKLTAMSAVKVAVDGQDLFARMKAAQDNLADAEAMIKDVLAKHISCVVAEQLKDAQGKPFFDLDPKSGEVSTRVHVRIDMAKYTQFANEVVQKLTPMATRVAKVMSGGDPNREKEYAADGHVVYKLFPNVTNEDRSSWDYLLIMTSFKTGTATVLWFDKNRMSTIRSCLDTGSLAFAVTLVDALGNEIAERNVPLDDRHKARGNFNTPISLFVLYRAAILPLFDGYINSSWLGVVTEGIGKGETDKIFHVSLGNFSAEELKSIGHLEIKVGHMKNGQFTEEGQL